MSNVPTELRYTSTHEWLRSTADDGIFEVGITDHAQGLLGDVVFVDLPEVGAEFEAGDMCCAIESVKAASDIYYPIAGEIVEVNENLRDQPELVNSNPHDEGWIFRIKAKDPDDIHELLDAEGYLEHIGD